MIIIFTKDAIEAFKFKMKDTPQVANTVIALLSVVYNWAKQNKIDVYYIDRPYWGETRNHPYYVKIVKNNHLKYLGTWTFGHLCIQIFAPSYH